MPIMMQYISLYPLHPFVKWFPEIFSFPEFFFFAILIGARPQKQARKTLSSPSGFSGLLLLTGRADKVSAISHMIFAADTIRTQKIHMLLLSYTHVPIHYLEGAILYEEIK